MSRRIWETVETKIREGRVAKVEGKESKAGSRKETREKEGREKTEEEKTEDNRCKEGSGRMGNLEEGRRSCKVRGRSKKAGPRKISQVD